MGMEWLLLVNGNPFESLFPAPDDHLDNIPLQDSITIDLVNLQFQPQTSDSLVIADSFTFQVGGTALGILLPVEDLIFFDDAVALLEEFSELEAGDNLLLTDFSNAFLTCLLSFSDQLTLVDSQNFVLSSNLFSDSYTLADTVSVFITGSLQEQSNDSLSLTDGVNVSLGESFTGYLRRYLNDAK